MRQFGNESDENGNADGEFDAAINSRSFNLVDAADIVAAADVTRPGALLDSQANDAPVTDAASDLPPLPPSIADWLPTFRPFASSLSDLTRTLTPARQVAQVHQLKKGQLSTSTRRRIVTICRSPTLPTAAPLARRM